MAFPFKTGGDFYNCEAQRMRLHNLGANPTETATGLMYFNTGASNLGKHAVVHDGTNFKALAFVDEIATNTAFTELFSRVTDLETALGTDEKDVLDTWEEVKTFLASIKESDGDLMTMLNSKLDKTGGTISGTSIAPLIINTSASDSSVVFRINSVSKTQIGYNPSLGSFIYNYSSSKSIGIKDDGTPHFDNNTLIHSGNIGEHKAGGLQTSTGADAVTIDGYLVKTSSALSVGTFLNINRNANTGTLFDSSKMGFEIEPFASRIVFKGYNTSGLSVGGIFLNSSGNVTIGGSDSGITNAKLYVDGRVYSKTAFLFDGDYGIWKGAQYTGSMALTDIIYNGTKHSFLNGNVGIGTTNPLDNLHVEGRIRMRAVMLSHISDDLATSGAYLLQYYTPSNKLLALTSRSGNTSAFKNFIFTSDWNNGHIGLRGEPSPDYSVYVTGSLGISGDTHIKGDLIVDGNIVGKKEVSAGGAGQEGESGDGGAEVISQPLAKGQSTYTITNTIKRSDIAVSLYEANVINGQTIWSLCLADIEVTNETITVTFGSATSVNHKLVAVG